MIDALYQEGTDAALDDQVRRLRPTPPPTEPGAFAGAATAAPRGVAAGAAEVIAFGAEMAGAFGQTLAATGGSAGGMFARPAPAERTQEEQARARLVERGGIDFSNPAGDAFRARAKDLMPDPQTTGFVGELLGGLGRFGGKAIGYSLLGGPVVGALLTGGDEALTEADKLKQQGVDRATRTKVGAVAGVAAGAAVALPVAGRTLAQTAGLVAAGGPGAFVAQQAASRAILDAADYSKQAATYDPLDPVGLAVSTLVPAGFGAVALRGSRGSLADTVLHLESRGNRYGKDGKLLTSPKGAQGEMQVMPGTSRDPGYGVRPAQNDSPEELARVGRDYIAAMQARYGDDAKALAAYNAGPGALDAALEAKGADWLSALPKETRDYVANGMRRMGAAAVRGATEARPELVDAARVHQVQQAVADAGLHAPEDLAGAQQHFDAVIAAGDQMARGERVDVTPRIEPPSAEGVVRLDDMRARLSEVLTAATRAEDVGAPPAAAAPVAAPDFAPPAAGATAAPREAPAARAMVSAAPEARGSSAATAEAGVRAAEPTPLDLRTEQLHTERPDLLTHLDGMERPAPAREVVEMVRREAARDAQDADLLRVAAECFLRT